MGKFKRGLRQEAILALEQLTASTGDNWWKELLRAWAPSGCGAGLRLAVRANTLDFYFKGHCVAHIGFSQGKRGVPAPVYMKCHVRYIFEDKIAGQHQALFDAEKGLWKHERLTQARSLHEILTYIAKWKGEATPAEKPRKADEKAGVDAIVGNNSNVIDLEMALPAWAGSDSALRMDLVALERAENAIQIAFWEAKTFDDGRLRSEEGDPEVIRQLIGKGKHPGYTDYLNHDDHEANIRDAYVRTCSMLAKLHGMKCAVSNGDEKSSLHPLVMEVAELAGQPEANVAARLLVKRKPGLVIYSDGKKVIEDDQYWLPHRKRITDAGINILERQWSKDIVLPDAQIDGVR